MVPVRRGFSTAQISPVCNPTNRHLFASMLQTSIEIKKSPMGHRPNRPNRGAIMDAPIRAHDKTANALLPQRMRGKLPSAPEPFTVTDAPLIAPGTADSDVDLPLPRSGQFEGDIGIKELRHRLSLDPGVVPKPPIRTGRKNAVLRKGLLLLAAIIVAVVGVLVMKFREEAGKLEGSSNAMTITLPSPARLVVENQKGFHKRATSTSHFGQWRHWRRNRDAGWARPGQRGIGRHPAGLDRLAIFGARPGQGRRSFAKGLRRRYGCDDRSAFGQ